MEERENLKQRYIGSDSEHNCTNCTGKTHIHGDSVGEFDGVDQVEGAIAEVEIEIEIEEAVREDGQERQRQGRDPQPPGSQAHRQDPQGRRSPRHAHHFLINPPFISF